MALSDGPRVRPSAETVRRQNAVMDLWLAFNEAHLDDPDYTPDDDPEFVAQARASMGMPS